MKGERAADPDRLLTRTDVAALLQVDTDEVTRLVRCGMPHYTGFGRGYRFTKCEVLEWITRFRRQDFASRRSVA